MSERSAGILLFRMREGKLEVMLVHPGGPFWAKKDAGAWSIPKGLYGEDEDPVVAAKREFKEETGAEVEGNLIELGELRQPRKKIVKVWAVERDFDEKNIVSNTFKLEWPKNSGKVREYPEIDKAGWFAVDEAKKKILKGQLGFIDRLLEITKYPS